MSSDADDGLALDQVALAADICRGDFWEFCRRFWDEVPGALPMVYNWHMEYLAQELQEVAERVFRHEPRRYDVVINIPPGTSKSSICSILFPAWVWTRMARARILTASHTAELVLELSNKARLLIKSDKYRRLFPGVEIRDDQDAKGHYATTEGGDRFTSTVAGKSPTGWHAHFLIIDDPIDPKQANSDELRRSAREFFDNVLPSRKVDKEVAVTIVIMQRLHWEDPTGHLIRKAEKGDPSRIKHVCLPAELVVGSDGAFVESDVRPRELAKRYVGGLLDPRRMPRHVLEEYRRDGEMTYAGQFLQRPFPPGGGLFKAEYFTQFRKAAPYEAIRIRYWDRAATEEGGAATAGVLMAKDSDGNFYVEDCVVGHWEPVRRNDIILATAQKDRRRYGPKYEPRIYVEAEGGSSGKDAFKDIAKKLAGFVVREDRVTGDKDTRAEPWSAQLAARNVYLIDSGEHEGTGRAGWDIDAYVTQHLLFKPESGKRGRLKDMVDASSGSFNLLVKMKAGPALRSLSFGGRKKAARRIVVATREQFAAADFDNHDCLLVVCDEPPNPHRPTPLGVEAPPSLHVKDTLTLQIADLSPDELQDAWEVPVEPWGELPARLVMSREHGVRLWAFLGRQRPYPAPLLTVFVGDTRIPRSLAEGMCDAFRVPAAEHVQSLTSRSGDATLPTQGGGGEVNRHVRWMTKYTRSFVPGAG